MDASRWRDQAGALCQAQPGQGGAVLVRDGEAKGRSGRRDESTKGGFAPRWHKARTSSSSFSGSLRLEC